MKRRISADFPPYRALILFLALGVSAPALCLAGQEPDTPAQDLMTASLNVPPLVILPDLPADPLYASEGDREGPVKTTGGPGRIHAAAHIVGSHLGIVTRPFSTVHKLFSMLFYTGQDTIRDVLLRDAGPEPLPPVGNGPGMDLARWEEDLDGITGTKLSSGRIKLLIDGGEFYPRLTRTFLHARKSIDIRIYIYDNDDYAMKIGQLLKEKSRKVGVRILADGLGTLMANRVHPETVPGDHEPLVSVRDYFSRDSKVRMRLQKNLWLTLDHAKTIIVDRETAFLGGMNIGREYRYDWHDLMVEVKGPVVSTLQDEFNLAWAYAGFMGDLGWLFTRRGSRHAGGGDLGYPLRVLFTRTSDSQIYRAQLAAIKRSSSYIYIQTPYFSDDAMLHELLKARRRGVDVRVILPREGNWKVMDRSNKLAANAMLAGGIRVYLYPVMSHVKAAVFDGWACLGSANFDKASFRTNQEINLATSQPEVVRELLERLFHSDFKRSTLMVRPNPERWSDPIYEMLADHM